MKRLTRITFYDKARVRFPLAVLNGPDADGRSTDLQSDCLGSIPTVSTKKKGLFVQRLGCYPVTVEVRVRFPHRPQNSRLITLRMEGSKLPIDYSVMVHTIPQNRVRVPGTWASQGKED